MTRWDLVGLCVCAHGYWILWGELHLTLLSIGGRTGVRLWAVFVFHWPSAQHRTSFHLLLFFGWFEFNPILMFGQFHRSLCRCRKRKAQSAWCRLASVAFNSIKLKSPNVAMKMHAFFQYLKMMAPFKIIRLGCVSHGSEEKSFAKKTQSKIIIIMEPFQCT